MPPSEPTRPFLGVPAIERVGLALAPPGRSQASHKVRRVNLKGFGEAANRFQCHVTESPLHAADVGAFYVSAFG